MCPQYCIFSDPVYSAVLPTNSCFEKQLVKKKAKGWRCLQVVLFTLLRAHMQTYNKQVKAKKSVYENTIRFYLNLHCSNSYFHVPFRKKKKAVLFGTQHKALCLCSAQPFLDQMSLHYGTSAFSGRSAPRMLLIFVYRSTRR